MNNQDFAFGRDPKQVGLLPEVAERMKQNLKFETKSQFYLHIPQKDFLYMVIFCLVAKEGKLSKKITRILSNLDGGIKSFIETTYIEHNSKRVSFNGPLELEILSKTLNYNLKIFKETSNKFTKSIVDSSLDWFKEAQCVTFQTFESKEAKNVDLGKVIDSSKSKNGFFLWESDENTFVLASFSADGPFRESHVEEKIIEQEKKRSEKKGKKEEEKPEQKKQKQSNKSKQEGEIKKKQTKSAILKKQATFKIWNEDSWIFCIFLILILIGALYLIKNSQVLEGLLARFPINTGLYKIIYQW